MMHGQKNIKLHSRCFHWTTGSYSDNP